MAQRRESISVSSLSLEESELDSVIGGEPVKGLEEESGVVRRVLEGVYSASNVEGGPVMRNWRRRGVHLSL